jgi:hypothetical protein
VVESVEVLPISSAVDFLDLGLFSKLFDIKIESGQIEDSNVS